MKCNLFTNCKQVTPSLTRDVGYFLDRIRKGKSQRLIERIRLSTDEKKQRELKGKLPAVTFNGTFKKRSKKELKEPSGFMILDFDDFDSKKQAQEHKEKLKEDEHIFAAWFSPRMGVKALYRIKKVKDDKELKRIYSEASKKYPNLDSSGKDISRLCFESYDPDIYVNLDAVTFSPTIILEEEIDKVGTVSNIPIKDENEIVNRLIIWFEKKNIYDENKRNTSIFILACAFNKFGISKQTATEYGFRYAKSEAPAKEVYSIIDNAYKKTNEWNTRSFEDKKGKKRLKNMVASGRSDKEISEAFKENDQEKLKEEIKATRSNVNPEKFWEYNFKGEPKIKPYKLKIFLESKGFSKYYPDDGSNSFIFITKDDNFVDIVSEYQIKDFVTKDLERRYEIDIFNIVAEKTKLFTYQYLSILNTSNVEAVKDEKDFAMLYYQNKAVKVEKDNVTEIEYDDLDGYVWRNSIIERDYKNVDHHKSQFRTFLWLISGKEKDRYNSFKSAVGYLLHSYKNSANNKAIILNDEKISDNPNGGSGKGILLKAIRRMKNYSKIDGKTFDPNSSFPYQTVKTDSQILAFDDVKRNFNFETLFSVITEGLTIEYKGKDAITLDVEESPKVVISTNYTIKAEGGSFERRMFEMELSSYFNSNHTPFEEFGNMLFDDWDEYEWQLFDKFMINCLQYYLENGLVEYEHVNLEIRKLISNTSQEFVDFMSQQNLYDGKRINYKELKIEFEDDFEDFKDLKWFKQRTFNNWIVKYVEYKGFKHESINVNGTRNYQITAITEEAKTAEKVENESDEIPY